MVLLRSIGHQTRAHLRTLKFERKQIKVLPQSESLFHWLEVCEYSPCSLLMEYTPRELRTLNLGNNYDRKTLKLGQTVLYLRKQIQPLDNSNVPRSDYITARDQSMEEVVSHKAEKTLPVFFFVNEHNNLNTNTTHRAKKQRFSTSSQKRNSS